MNNIGRTSNTWGKPRYKCKECGEEFRCLDNYKKHKKKCQDEKNN